MCSYILFRAGELDDERRAGARLRANVQPPAHPLHELARDVEAEPGAARRARQLRPRSVELLEDPLLLGERDARARSRRRRGARRRSPARRERCTGVVAAVLDRVVEEVDEHLLDAVARAGRRADLGRDVDVDLRRSAAAATASPRRSSARARRGRPARSRPTSVPRSSCVASSTASVIWLSRAACSATISSICRFCSGVSSLVALEQRLRGAVDGGHRRPQLVRDRRDEVALLLVEPPLARQVAERVDDAVRRRARRRTTARGRARRRATGSVTVRAAAPCSTTGIRATSAGHSGKTSVSGRVPQASSALRPVTSAAARFQRRTMPASSTRKIPSPTSVEHVRRLLALGGDRPRRRLGGLEPPLLLLQARVADGGRHLLHEPVDELELLLRVRAAVRHHLDDADDAPLVLDRNHHRGARFRAARTPAACARSPRGRRRSTCRPAR